MPEQQEADPLELLESLVQKIPEAKSRKSFGGALGAATHALSDLWPRIQQLEAVPEQTAFVRDSLDSLDTQSFRHHLDELSGIAQLLEEASDAESLSIAIQAVRGRCGQAISQINQLITRGWKDKVDKTFAASERLGSVLKQIPETARLGEAMEAVAGRAEQLTASTKAVAERLSDYQDLVAERDRNIESLTSLGAGKDVVHFLLAVAEQTATLLDANEHVRKWLTERNSLARFRVGF